MLNKILDQIGPKWSAAIAGSMTALGGLGVDFKIPSGVSEAVQTGDVKAIVLAAGAAVFAYVIRGAKPNTNQSAIDYADEMYSQKRDRDDTEYVMHVNERITQTEDAVVELSSSLQGLSTSVDSSYMTIQDKVIRLDDILQGMHTNVARLQNEINQRPHVDHIVTERSMNNIVSAVKQLERRMGTTDELVKAMLVDSENRVNPLDETIDAAPIQDALVDDDAQWYGDPDQPMGIRNNNIGNIRPSKGQKWRGEIDSGKDAYAHFETAALGVRAMMYLLRKAYFARHGLTTVAQIIERWSPRGEGTGNSDAAVDNYIKHVAKALNVTPEQPLVIHVDDDQLVDMVVAMAEFENGKPPPYSDSVYDEALILLKK